MNFRFNARAPWFAVVRPGGELFGAGSIPIARALNTKAGHVY